MRHLPHHPISRNRASEHIFQIISVWRRKCAHRAPWQNEHSRGAGWEWGWRTRARGAVAIGSADVGTGAQVLATPTQGRRERTQIGGAGTRDKSSAHEFGASAQTVRSAHANWRARHDAKSTTCSFSYRCTQNRGVGTPLVPAPPKRVRTSRQACRRRRFVCALLARRADAGNSCAHFSTGVPTSNNPVHPARIATQKKTRRKNDGSKACDEAA